MNTIDSNDRLGNLYAYYKKDYYKNPKEMFKFLGKILKKHMKAGMEYSLLDIGCARGEFLFYLKTHMDFNKMTGIDYSHSLINYAKNYKGLQDIEFLCEDAESINLNKEFDFIVISGTLNFFDDLFLILKNAKRHLRKDGLIVCLGLFNEYDIDVLIRHRNNKYSNEFLGGWNIHSIETIKKHLKKLDMKIKYISKFILPFKLEKQEDPARAWTLDTEEGGKSVNGLGMIYDNTVLEIVPQLP